MKFVGVTRTPLGESFIIEIRRRYSFSRYLPRKMEDLSDSLMSLALRSLPRVVDDKEQKLLAQLPLELRLQVVQLLRPNQPARCPLCSCTIAADQLVSHVWYEALQESECGKFRVSASMLGHYFDLNQCDRWLHRTARMRRAQSATTFLPSLQLARTNRGIEFEKILCERLHKEGIRLGDSQSPKIRFLPECEFNNLKDTERNNVGLFVDLEKKARDECPCAGCKNGEKCSNIGLTQTVVSRRELVNGGSVPTIFYQFMLTPASELLPAVTLSRACLDFLLVVPVGEKVECTVIDAKATYRVKLGAKVQVAFYSLALSRALQSIVLRKDREKGKLLPLCMSGKGGVWLPESEMYIPFQLSELEIKLGKVLKEYIPRVLSDNSCQKDWELTKSCLGCDFVNECRQEAKEKRLLRALPGITRNFQDVWQRVCSRLEGSEWDRLNEATIGNQVNADVRRLMSRHLLIHYDGEVPRNTHSNSASPRLAALLHGGQSYPNRRYNLTLPREEEVGVHLVVLEDPTVQRIYAWALCVDPTVAGEKAYKSSCAQSGQVDSSEYDTQERSLVDALNSVLTQAQDSTVAIFVAEEHERIALLRCLMSGVLTSVCDDTHRRLSLCCLIRLFALPEFLHLDQVPDASRNNRLGKVPSHCVVLFEEAKRLVSLPIPAPWTFSDICEWVIRLQGDKPTESLIYAAWMHFHAQCADAVGLLLSRRIDVNQKLLSVLRRDKSWLINSSVALPKVESIVHLVPEFSKLVFITMLESHTEHRTLVSLRAAPLDERIAQSRGRTFLLRLDSVSRDPKNETFDLLEMTIICQDKDGVQESIGGNEWLLCPNTDAGTADVLRFNDLAYLDRPLLGPNSVQQRELKHNYILLAHVIQSRPAEAKVTLRVQSRWGTEMDMRVITQMKFEEKSEYILQPRYLDYTSGKIVQRLRDDSAMVHEYMDIPGILLIRHTEDFSNMKPAPTVDAQSVTSFPMTASQEAIYSRVCGATLTVTWGPPGSGKTYFIAATISRLITWARRAKMSMRILVTAFTHQAINLVLDKVASMLKTKFDDEIVFKFGAESRPIEVGCLVRFKKGEGDVTSRYLVTELKERSVSMRNTNAEGREVEALVDRIVRVNKYGDLSTSCKLKVVDKPQVVLGASVYQMHRIRDRLVSTTHFDALVIDEASQMQFSHAFLPLSLLRNTISNNGQREYGRFLVVGDTFQMGPLLRNEYPANSTLCHDSPPPHWSLLRWLWERRTLDPDSMKKMLRENHRMTPELATFTERVLGYSGYKPCGQSGCKCHQNGMVPPLSLKNMPMVNSHENVDIYMSILHPASSFVLLELQAKNQMTFEAVEFEAKLVAGIVQRYFRWRDDKVDESIVFVVSPHHSQRNAISRHLEELGITDDSVRVDTVERMQGQECDLVIVCYASMVTFDTPGDLDFAFDRQRLNTAVTRAKKKCILLCSECLLDPPMAACETAERQDGWDLFQCIARHCCPSPRPVDGVSHAESYLNGCVHLSCPENVSIEHLSHAEPSLYEQASGADQASSRYITQMSSTYASQLEDDWSGEDLTEPSFEGLPPVVSVHGASVHGIVASLGQDIAGIHSHDQIGQTSGAQAYVSRKLPLTMTTPRKVRHCKTCLMPMKGHKKAKCTP